MISSPPPRGRVKLSAPAPRLGSEMTLTLTLEFPGKAPVPLELRYSLPADSEIVHSDIELDRQSAPGSIVAHWKGLQTERKEWAIRFKLTRPGFYHLSGKISLLRDDSANLQGLQEEVAKNIPDLQGADADAIRRQQEFVRTGQSLKIVEDALAFMPPSLYVKVREDVGRVEDWDFGSLWKRLKHRWQH
ncbi:MAG: hypothetical protein AAB036_01910 [Elusimicrobiota bacterium]